MGEIDLSYKSIGEFVVAFQWIENKYREIGWFILDPERRQWPPMELRKETNSQLIDKVTKLYCDLVDTFDLPGSVERKEDFLTLQEEFHQLRRYRNTLLHSTFIELKAGGEVLGILRSNPVVNLDTDTGEFIFDQEIFTSTAEERVDPFAIPLLC